MRTNGVIVYLSRATRSPLSFKQVDFALAESVREQDVPEFILGRFRVGYRHMYRFFAGTIFRYAALQSFDWY